MNKKRDYAVTVLGILLLGVGLCLIKTLVSPTGVLRVLPYICIGVGCGAFGHGVGGLLSARAVAKNPALQQQMEIERRDERNVAISNRAKARAYDMMTFVFAALMVSFALMGVETAPLLLLVFAYLLVEGYGVYCRVRYEREM